LDKVTKINDSSFLDVKKVKYLQSSFHVNLHDSNSIMPESTTQ
jgi:hypothetical protein